MKKFALLICLTCQLAILSARAKSVTTAPDSFIYHRAGNKAMKAYVFKPADDGKRHPAILLFHGGAWRLGDAAWTFGRAKEFADDGMVAVCIDYRLSNDGLSPIDGVEDACAAFAWVRRKADEFHIDVKRVAGYGLSAGGHLVAAAALIPAVRGEKITSDQRPNALLLYSPALNMAHDSYFNYLMKDKGDPAMYSPSEYISKKLPPTLIIQDNRTVLFIPKTRRHFMIQLLKQAPNASCTFIPT